ncbi:MAG: type II toxin-antitoxin system RelB/DinJ family antitoxin [Gammaproteobacteria bacterium]|nr:type II toxin-antitoxin system RelB/DinJ family antitoxin [Gammaproteobacteria bacterium]
MNLQNKDTFVKARVNSFLKQDVEEILSDLGLNISDVINLMLCQIKLCEGLPFDVKRPNKLTQKTLEESKKGKNVKRFKNAQDLFDDLGI